jgi:hypothetical protein
MEPTECSETSAFNIQTPGKYPEESTSYLQHGESLKTTKKKVQGLEDSDDVHCSRLVQCLSASKGFKEWTSLLHIKGGRERVRERLLFYLVTLYDVPGCVITPWQPVFKTLS